MSSHSILINRFLNNHLIEGVASFKKFIINCFEELDVLNLAEEERQKLRRDFMRQAQEMGLICDMKNYNWTKEEDKEEDKEEKKGTEKEVESKEKKESFTTAETKSSEETQSSVESLQLNSVCSFDLQHLVFPDLHQEKHLIYQDCDLSFKFSTLKQRFLEEFKQNNSANIQVDDERLLALFSVLSVPRNIKESSAIVEVVEETFLDNFNQKIRRQLYGRKNRFPVDLFSRVKEAFDDYEEDEEEELKIRLLCLKTEDKAAKRVIAAVSNIIDSLTVEVPKEIKEGKLGGSFVNPFIQGLLKTNKFFDPHYADECLDSITACRPDHCTTVTTIKRKKYINCVGEIKPLLSKMTTNNWNLVRLDRIRTAIFSKIFLDEKKVGHFLSFYTIGPCITFFISTNQYEGMTLNLELGTINLPTTYDDFPKIINELDMLYDIVKIYQEFCVQNNSVVLSNTSVQPNLSYSCLLSLCSIKTNSRKRSYSKTE